jgi:uncharacterized metal-binding protein
MNDPKCAECKPRYCNSGIRDPEKLPDFCPMLNFKETIEEALQTYRKEAVSHVFLQAAITEKECYDEKKIREEGKIVPLRPRIREISAFAEKIGASKIGLAFCGGLADEGARAAAILKSHGLNVASVVCSCGAIDKTDLGIPEQQKIRSPENFEASCNPISQAAILNAAETDFNVIVGLCVGHDMLFTQHSQAPVTTLIVKDRFTGHNPVITLYSRYHRDLV